MTSTFDHIIQQLPETISPGEHLLEKLWSKRVDLEDIAIAKMIYSTVNYRLILRFWFDGSDIFELDLQLPDQWLSFGPTLSRPEVIEILDKLIHNHGL